MAQIYSCVPCSAGGDRAGQGQYQFEFPAEWLLQFAITPSAMHIITATVICLASNVRWTCASEMFLSHSLTPQYCPLGPAATLCAETDPLCCYILHTTWPMTVTD